MKNFNFLKMKNKIKNLSEKAEQLYTSASTSQNQIASLFKLIKIDRDIFDVGAGKYNKAKDYVEEKGFKYLPYDPYNLPEKTNKDSLKEAKKLKGKAVCCANVLNVVKELKDREEIYKLIISTLKNGDVVYFTVYEGDKTGKGKESKKDCWQNNLPTKGYLDELKKYFNEVSLKGKLITCKK